VKFVKATLRNSKFLKETQGLIFASS